MVLERAYVKKTAATGECQKILSQRLVIEVQLDQPTDMPLPSRKPYCIASIRSNFECRLSGDVFRESGEAPQPFITSLLIRLPYGWDCIEIFPYLDLNGWRPENATLWAEFDILAIAAAQQHRDTELNSLDPLSSARQIFFEDLQTFKELLDTNPDREEILHNFLKDHPELLCPSAARMWSKLPFGSKVSDFVFRDAIGDYLLVEIERSTLPLFIKSGDPSSELNHACSQIADWKRYIQDNLSTLQRELALDRLSSNPRSLVVIGRSETLTPENRRKLTTMESETPTRKIMTYDDVYHNAKTLLENMFGPLWTTGGKARVFYPKQ